MVLLSSVYLFEKYMHRTYRMHCTHLAWKALQSANLMHCCFSHCYLVLVKESLYHNTEESQVFRAKLVIQQWCPVVYLREAHKQPPLMRNDKTPGCWIYKWSDYPSLKANAYMVAITDNSLQVFKRITSSRHLPVRLAETLKTPPPPRLVWTSTAGPLDLTVVASLLTLNIAVFPETVVGPGRQSYVENQINLAPFTLKGYF